MIDPKLLDFATDRQREYIEAVNEHGSNRKAAKALGVNRTSLDKAIIALRQRAARMGYSPAHDMTRTVPDGYSVKGVSTYYDKEGKAAGQWVKSTADRDRQAQIMREAFDAMAESLPRETPVRAPQITSDALLNLYTFTDYHMGMLAWHREGGADWDLRIAEEMLFAAFANMVDRAPPAKIALLNIQGDFLHFDGLLAVTPTSKHVVDADSRFGKIIHAAMRVLRRLVRFALSKHERVHLKICEGNHDETSAKWMPVLFSAVYEDEPRLSVDDAQLPFYTYQHGTVMLAFHHGHKVTNEQLPMLFAAQFPKLWGDTTHRYAHCGHRHHVDEKEYSGMIVTQHPTLAARDAYSARGGWISNRAAQAITYHSQYGQVGRTIVTPEMLEAA